MADDPSDTNKDPRPPQPNQLSTSLPGPTTYILGHNESGKAKVYEARPANWTPFDDKQMAFSTIYTNKAPANLNGDDDLKIHDELVSSKALGLVRPGGTACRFVDFAPGYDCTMHRTRSLDFGVVIEGEVELLLDDGSTTLVRRGDVVVQRATMHAWRNPSKTEWLRMLFVLQDVEEVVVGGEVYGEDLKRPVDGLAPSGN